ncbi:beta strand repeat-containing protein [Dictyobacter arantiisoli]|uniref:Uncharacterized protein n=1 Tax=Dictyobacter arantiisoli TaxID=2014874 RepID=A0A5A5TI23_9CHLR|nr:hypothetical protein [Dictyobacter arantiisoli]GCF10713.1 hypothetical protein KDI_42770 [Dictyobacter arantiisoli]
MMCTQGRRRLRRNPHERTRAHTRTTRLLTLFCLCTLITLFSGIITPGQMVSAASTHANGIAPTAAQRAATIRHALKQRIHVLHHPKALSSSSTPKTAKQNVILPAYNNAGSSNDSNPNEGSFDGNNSYSVQALQGTGLLPGQNFTFSNVTFVWPNAAAGTPNNYLVNGQVIPVAPSIAGAANLGFLGASTNGNASGNATVTFTDATTQTFSLGLSDWTLGGNPQSTPAFSNQIAATMTYRNTPVDQQTITTFLFSAQLALPAGKTVQSVTLPTTTSSGQMHIFAVGISGPAYNNTGTSDDASPTSGNFDGSTRSYSAQALQSAGVKPGSTIINDGLSYTFPNAAPGTANNYTSSGQILPVVSVPNAVTLGVLGSAISGASSGTATITFTDASTQTVTLGFSDWTLGGNAQTPPSFGNQIAATMSYRNTAGGKQTVSTFLFSTEFAIPAGKTVQNLTLPTASTPGQLHIFAISTRGAYNNISTSDDANLTSANFDLHTNGGNSYSAQALQSQNILPGQSVVSDGISYTWPSAPAGTPNNYLAAGQTISVTPVANATTLGFLGSATNGSTSGTATITYTDNSTSTFTLGLTDWATNPPVSGNLLVATFPYLNHAAGQQTTTNYLYATETSLAAGKTIQSVTLPSITGQLHIFAIGTRSSYNNIGISDTANTHGADFDGFGRSYAAQDFSDPVSGMGWNPGDTLIYNGMNLIWPAAPSGQADNYQTNGQTIAITPVANADTLGFVGASTGGATAITATITYTDNSTSTFQLGMSDWTLGNNRVAPSYNNQLFALLTHRNLASGQENLDTYLFYAETTISAAKVVKSVTLPAASTGTLHIFTIGTRAGNGYPNNIGTSDEADSTAFANYDGQGDTYSLQSLQNDHITQGQPVIVNGISYLWPASYSVIPDNYQAAGQTVGVTPVANATTLGFLGSATNGSTSGTATITYTDNSTSTFTLGFTDWATTPAAYSNTLVASMPNRNTSTGSQSTKTYLYETETSIPAGKTVQSVTLPSISGQLHIFAIGTRADQYNNAGTSDDSTPYTANIDNANNSYSAQGLKSIGLAPGQSISVNGMAFLWPNATAGFFDNYQAHGQTIAVTPVANATTLGFLGAATGGATSGSATLTYTDHSTQTFTLGFADWNATSITSLPYGNSIVGTMPYRNTPAGAKTINTYVFATTITLQTGKTLQSVTLPSTTSPGALHVFTIGTK